MDSDHSSSASPAAAVRSCTRGKRMSTLRYDFHSVCVDCRGVDCDVQIRCIECTDVDDIKMTEYVSHRLGLKRCLLAEQKRKSSSCASKVKVEPEVLDGSSSPTVPSLSDLPVVTSAPDTAPIMDQVKLMLDSFRESMEASFVARFSQVSSCSASPVKVSDVSSQVVTNVSFPAPIPVAVRLDHALHRGPCVQYTDGLGHSLGGPATVSASTDVTPLAQMYFSELLATVQLLERRGRVPDSFVESLHENIVVASEFDFAIGGASLVNSIRAFRNVDPLHLVPGSSRGGGGQFGPYFVSPRIVSDGFCRHLLLFFLPLLFRLLFLLLFPLLLSYPLLFLFLLLLLGALA